MAPIGLLLIFVKNYVISSYLSPDAVADHGGADGLDGYEDDDEEHEDEKEEKKTIKARLQAVQEVTAMVQNAIGKVASLAESVKNTFNFSVPFLSWLAIVVLAAVAAILYFISLRFLVMVWGLNKFTKKLIRPNYVPNNELLDFLSRVPDDEELLDVRELRAADAAGGHSQHDASDKKGADGAKGKKKKQ